MIQKRPVPPATQRRFATIWGELDYLCRKVRYWLYTKGRKSQADRYVERLERVLGELPENDLAIIRQEGLALLAELRDDLKQAIVHRKREIQLIERLHKDAASSRYDSSTRAYLLQDCDTATLQERRAILEALEGQTE